MNINGKIRAGIASAALAVVVVGTVAVASSSADEPTLVGRTTTGDVVEQTVESTSSAAPATTEAVEATTTTVEVVPTTRAPAPTTTIGKVDNGGDAPAPSPTSTPTPTDQCPEIAQPGQINGCALTFDPNGSPPKPYRECWDGTLRQECPPLNQSDGEPAGS